MSFVDKPDEYKKRIKLSAFLLFVSLAMILNYFFALANPKIDHGLGMLSYSFWYFIGIILVLSSIGIAFSAHAKYLIENGKLSNKAVRSFLLIVIVAIVFYVLYVYLQFNNLI